MYTTRKGIRRDGDEIGRGSRELRLSEVSRFAREVVSKVPGWGRFDSRDVNGLAVPGSVLFALESRPAGPRESASQGEMAEELAGTAEERHTDPFQEEAEPNYIHTGTENKLRREVGELEEKRGDEEYRYLARLEVGRSHRFVSLFLPPS